jgi:hypothetical protein
MWLVSTDHAELHELTQPLPVYAILSNVKGQSKDSSQRLQELRKACASTGKNSRDEVSQKIRNCCLTAQAEGLDRYVLY